MVPLTQRVFGTFPLARSFDERIDRCRELPRVGPVRDAGLQASITAAIHSFHLFAPKLSHGPWSGQTLQRRRVLFRSGSHRRLKGNFGGFDWNDPGFNPDQPSPSKFSRHRHHHSQTKRARSARLIELRLTRSTPCTLSGAGTT